MVLKDKYDYCHADKDKAKQGDKGEYNPNRQGDDFKRAADKYINTCHNQQRHPRFSHIPHANTCQRDSQSHLMLSGKDEKSLVWKVW